MRPSWYYVFRLCSLFLFLKHGPESMILYISMTLICVKNSDLDHVIQRESQDFFGIKSNFLVSRLSVLGSGLNIPGSKLSFLGSRVNKVNIKFF